MENTESKTKLNGLETTMQDGKCLVCDRPFNQKPGRGRRRIYCSNKCRDKSSRRHIRHELVCEKCGKVFSSRYRTARYCSSVCRRKYQGTYEQRVKEAKRQYHLRNAKPKRRLPIKGRALEVWELRPVGMTYQELGENMGFKRHNARKLAYSFLKQNNPSTKSLNGFAEAMEIPISLLFEGVISEETSASISILSDRQSKLRESRRQQRVFDRKFTNRHLKKEAFKCELSSVDKIGGNNAGITGS